MTPDSINRLLGIMGYTQKKIADELGTSKTNVYQVIHRRSRSKRVEQKIAHILGINCQDIWPRNEIVRL